MIAVHFNKNKGLKVHVTVMIMCRGIYICRPGMHHRALLAEVVFVVCCFVLVLDSKL